MSKEKTADKLSRSVIVSFANQKGGVGKSTLCALFALYLSQVRGLPVTVYDLDPQRSLFKKRKDEIAEGKVSRDALPYNLDGFAITNTTMLGEMLQYAHSDDPDAKRVYLADCPGGVGSDGFNILLPNSDFIVVPYRYDLVTVKSTGAFLNFIKTMMPNVGEDGAPRVLLVPNRMMVSYGTAIEWKMSEDVDETFGHYGEKLARIKQTADMERFTTYKFIGTQQTTFAETFASLAAAVIPAAQ